MYQICNLLHSTTSHFVTSALNDIKWPWTLQGQRYPYMYYGFWFETQIFSMICPSEGICTCSFFYWTHCSISIFFSVFTFFFKLQNSLWEQSQETPIKCLGLKKNYVTVEGYLIENSIVGKITMHQTAAKWLWTLQGQKYSHICPGSTQDLNSVRFSLK